MTNRKNPLFEVVHCAIFNSVCSSISDRAVTHRTCADSNYAKESAVKCTCRENIWQFFKEYIETASPPTPKHHINFHAAHDAGEQGAGTPFGTYLFLPLETGFVATSRIQCTRRRLADGIYGALVFVRVCIRVHECQKCRVIYASCFERVLLAVYVL